MTAIVGLPMATVTLLVSSGKATSAP